VVNDGSTWGYDWSRHEFDQAGDSYRGPATLIDAPTSIRAFLRPVQEVNFYIHLLRLVA